LGLELDEPARLANFVAFCRRQRVYLRGENRRHRSLLPSLFRNTLAPNDRATTWRAYRLFLQKLRENLRGTRFSESNLGAVLQHYGFRTPWLDVLDDMHAAVWFALNRRCDLGGTLRYRRSEADSGWIIVLATSGVWQQDLRRSQSSRHTRCHVQQGFSLGMQADREAQPRPDQDFASLVVGTVRIPNCERWRVRGGSSGISVGSYKDVRPPSRVKA